MGCKGAAPECRGARCRDAHCRDALCSAETQHRVVGVQGCCVGVHGEGLGCSTGSKGLTVQYREQGPGRGAVLLRLCPLAPPAGRAPPIKAGAVRSSLQCVRFSPFELVSAAVAMSTGMYQSPMEVAVYQLHNFSISFFSSLLGGDVVSVKLDNR